MKSKISAAVPQAYRIFVWLMMDGKKRTQRYARWVPGYGKESD